MGITDVELKYSDNCYGGFVKGTTYIRVPVILQISLIFYILTWNL